MVRHGSTALASLLALCAVSTGCAVEFGDFGISPGGSQDIELAREVIERGGVPDSSQFTAEGLFSQHDFSAPATAPCDQLLCPRASLARVEPVDGSGEQVLVHLALATNIDSLERPDLNLSLVVDVSGSMEGEKFDATIDALQDVVAQLDENDRVSLISFSDDARVEVPPTFVDDSGRELLELGISNLFLRGGTNIERGLLFGYDRVEDHHDGYGGVEDRVMLFTDAQPNIGSTDSGSFLALVNDGASKGIGISVFGVGLDLGADLAREISEARGGNSFYLSASQLETLFQAHFDEIVSPVAYDMRFNVNPSPGFSFVRSYGTPDANADGEVDFSVATGFLSSHGGAMAVLLEGDLSEAEGQPVVSFSLDYETPTGAPLSESFDVGWLGGDIPISDLGRADHSGSAKLAVLLDEYLALEAGALACAGQLSESDALARIDEAAARLENLAQTLNDDLLADEAELMRKLGENLTSAGCAVD